MFRESIRRGWIVSKRSGKQEITALLVHKEADRTVGVPHAFSSLPMTAKATLWRYLLVRTTGSTEPSTTLHMIETQ